MYKLPPLEYAYKELEPYMDEETLVIHHTKHHQKYIDNYYEAVKGTTMADQPLELIFREASKLPLSVARNGGQTYNHALFWRSIAPPGNSKPKGKLLNAIIREFKSYEAFKQRFTDAAAAQFGSGWAWLIRDGERLKITTTSNHINPLMDLAEDQGKPLFCVDVWEHAYYLKYQNKRGDYLSAIWNIINWDEANKRFQEK